MKGEKSKAGKKYLRKINVKYAPLFMQNNEDGSFLFFIGISWYSFIYFVSTKLTIFKMNASHLYISSTKHQDSKSSCSSSTCQSSHRS